MSNQQNHKDKSTVIDIDVAASRAYLRARWDARVQQQKKRQQVVVRALRTAATTVFPRFPQVRRAYLFGSLLNPGEMRPDSDVDVAIEGNLAAQAYFALWRELEHALRDVAIELDLVTLDQDIQFADQIRVQGDLIYERTD